MFWCLLNTVIVIQAAKYINVIILFRCRIFLWKLLLVSKESFTDNFTIASMCKLMCICIHMYVCDILPQRPCPLEMITLHTDVMAVHCFYVHPSRPYIIGGMPSTFRTITVVFFFTFVLEFFFLHFLFLQKRIRSTRLALSYNSWTWGFGVKISVRNSLYGLK